MKSSTNAFPARTFFSLIVASLSVLCNSHAHAGIDEVDSATFVSSGSNTLTCSQPGFAAFTASTRLPAVAGALTEVKLRGSGLVANEFDISLAGCNGACSISSATGSSGSQISIKANLGGASTSTQLLVRKKNTKDVSIVRFNIIDAATVTTVAPRDGILIGTNINIVGTGLAALELGAGANCFDLTTKTATAITLRSKCEDNNPAGTRLAQSFTLVRTGALASACKMDMAGGIQLATPQAQPSDLLAEWSSASGFTRIDPVAPDRRVADSFCTGAAMDILESDSSCSTQGSDASNNAQGIGGQTQCVTTAIKTQLFRRALSGKIDLTVKNIAGAEVARPFDVEIRTGDGRVLLTKRQTSAIAVGSQALPVSYVRPVTEIGYVKVTSLSDRRFLLKYGQPGCYRAKDEMGMPAASNDYSETEFVGVADAKNEVTEIANGKVNNTARLLPR